MTVRPIASILAWECLDSRGRPTVGCRVRLDDGGDGTVVVPSGASTGRHEARELRDGTARYGGWGVRTAVENVMTELAPALTGLDADDQRSIDAALRAADGTPQLSRLGANAVLAVSLAVWRATGAPPSGKVTLPRPMINILSGGAHAQRALDIQDILVIPLSAANVADAIEHAARVRTATSEIAVARGFSTALVADEGGYGLPLTRNRDALALVTEAITAAGFTTDEVAIAVDVAASQFHIDGRYRLGTEGRELDADAWAGELRGWIEEFPIVSLEDPFAEDDWEPWARLSADLPSGVQVIGDDLFATDPARLQHGIDQRAATAVLVKPNQIGTVTDARSVVELADAHGIRTVTSARSGDTEDSWLVDLALSWNSHQIKVGSLTRSERTAKWNRMLHLEADPDLSTTLARW